MSKKAMMLLYFLIIAVALGFGFYNLGNLMIHPAYGTEYVGETSIATIKSAHNAEKSLFYIDQSSKYSAYQSIYELAKKGGCVESEKYFGYNIWDNNKCNLDKESAKRNFIDLFKAKLDSFLQKYEPIKIPLNNYNLDFKDNNLIGLAAQPLQIPIFKDEKKTEQIGLYSVKPSFKVSLDYDFSDYDKLRKGAEELIALCTDQNLELCVDNNKYQFFSKDNFEISENCDNEEEEQFYEFLEYFESCAFSKDNSCICSQYRPNSLEIYEISQQGSDIIIINKNNPDLKYTINNAKLFDKSDYDSKKSFLHKDENGNIIVQESLNAKNQCTPNPKTKFRFCVKSTKSKFLVYDESDKKAEFRNPLYKFALDFGETDLTRSFEIGSIEITNAIKDLFKDKRVIIASECLETNQDVFDLANRFGSKVSETETQVIVPVSFDNCAELNNPEAFKQKYFDGSKPNILIILDSSSFIADRINYYSQNRKSEALSTHMLNKLRSLDNSYINFPTGSNALSLTDLSVQIIFKNEKLKEENNYVNAIFSGLVDYLVKEESPKAIFEHFEVKDPTGIRRGLVDFGWVNEIAKRENVNYYLLLSVIKWESIDFKEINYPNDGKAHGLGQQFLAAITDIYPDLIIRHPELKSKTPKEIYENVLTSKDENSLKIQITATALYLKRVKTLLKSQNKPTDIKTIIQAYHDGTGNINADGSSKLITQGNREAIDYYPKVAGNYNDLSGTALA